jgi:hypothetical protein
LIALDYGILTGKLLVKIAGARLFGHPSFERIFSDGNTNPAEHRGSPG